MSDRTLIEEARDLIQPLTGHTPSPWTAQHNGHYWELQSEAHGQIGDMCASAHTYIDGEIVARAIAEKFAAANAIIAAAAPTMRDTIAALADHAEALTAERDALAQRVETLTEALAFYAEPAGYDMVSEQLSCECCSDLYVPVERDGGEIARAALQPEGTP